MNTETSSFVVEMFREDGMTEKEIAQLTGLNVFEVNCILAEYEAHELNDCGGAT